MKVVGSGDRQGVVRPAAGGRGLAARFVCRLLTAALSTAASGCAYSAFEGPLANNVAAAARGERFAEQNCGACHALGPAGESAFPGAPPFRSMHYDFNAISYERVLARNHLGRLGMPPAEMSREDLADVGAYVRSLEHGARH